MNFETQAAYLEGRADIALEVMALVDKAFNNVMFPKGSLIDGLRGICSRTMQYDTEGLA